MISIITRTFNRAQTLPRAINSILDQDYNDIELIIVNDGSTDNTNEVIKQYNDRRIRVVNHSENKGMAAAFHTGLDNIRGEWFTLLDSDDEMVPGALTTMLKVLIDVNPDINAITCNCIDSSTEKFSGKGLEGDQYLDAKTIIQNCRGEFWGLTKTSLLPERNNEQYLASVWNKINKIANRYYIHKGLRIYHTVSNDRYSNGSSHMSGRAFQRRYNTFLSILDDKELLSDYKKWGKDLYRNLHYSMAVFFIQFGDRKLARYCIKEVAIMPESIFKSTILVLGYIFGKKTFDNLKTMKRKLFPKLILK